MGNTKGPNYERVISKKLSLWWTEGENDHVFWRTSGSGARATTRAKKGKKTKYEYGDITFRDPIGQPLIDFFLIECKKGYTDEINTLDFLDKKKGVSELEKIWVKAVGEKEWAERKESILIFERNRRYACIMMRNKFLNRLENDFGDFKDKIIIKTNYVLGIIRLEEFLDKVDPEFFKIEYLNMNELINY